MVLTGLFHRGETPLSRGKLNRKATTIRDAAALTLMWISLAVVAVAGDISNRRNLTSETFRSLLRAPSKAVTEQALGPNVQVVGFWLGDNGDGDAWADTNETVILGLALRNRASSSLTGVTAQLSTNDPAIACIGRSQILVGAIPIGATVVAEAAFEFTIAEITRASTQDEVTATLTIQIVSDQFPTNPSEHQMTIDLGFDATTGAGRSQFFESFESGFGSFEPRHLDATLNPPENDLSNHDLGLSNADGYRCQYANPEWEQSTSFQESSAETCYPNPNGMPDAFHFAVTEDRGFSGDHSMYFGLVLEPALGYTTPVSQLEAIATGDVIALGWTDVCSTSRTEPCGSDFDCPVGETCEITRPELSFKHQISLLDHRFLSTGGQTALDRAVVQAQVVDNNGTALAPWINLEPYFNTYDTQGSTSFIQCFFDPVDDGNSEDDFFDPADPQRRFGPSSTCSPEFNFVHQGGTDGPYSEQNIGDASDGPGLEGATGFGTWVESKFDLSRYRGRSIRLRFLVSQIKVLGSEVYYEDFGLNPDPRDDGWFLDDVRVTDTLESPAVLTVDSKDNLDIKGDIDFDGVAEACDCAPEDDSVWESPREVGVVSMEHSGGVTGTTTISWASPEFPGGTLLTYDLLRTSDPSDFTNPTVCLESGSADRTASDDTEMDPSASFYYLVRATNSCGTGNLGVTAEGMPRVGLVCP